MGLLDQLWDDTLAGPLPDNGLGKLRKHSTFSFRSNSGKEPDGGSARSYGEEPSLESPRISRSIMIVRPPGNPNGSPPVSPSTPTASPFSGKLSFLSSPPLSSSDKLHGETKLPSWMAPRKVEEPMSNRSNVRVVWSFRKTNH